MGLFWLSLFPFLTLSLLSHIFTCTDLVIGQEYLSCVWLKQHYPSGLAESAGQTLGAHLCTLTQNFQDGAREPVPNTSPGDPTLANTLDRQKCTNNVLSITVSQVQSASPLAH